MLYTNCWSREEKPGKNDTVQLIKTWMIPRNCPDCDKKRTTFCKDPNCVRRKMP